MMKVERERLSRTIVAREEEKDLVTASLVVSRKIYGEAVIDYNCLQDVHPGLRDIIDFESDVSREGSQPPVPKLINVGRPPAGEFFDAEAEGSSDDLPLVAEPDLVADEGDEEDEEEEEEEEEESSSYDYEIDFAPPSDQGEDPHALGVDEDSGSESSYSTHSSMPSLEPITPPMSIRGD